VQAESEAHEDDAMTQTLSRHGIGASEISTIAGCNPYETEWGLYLRKTGQAPDIDPTPPIEWGHRLEPAIRQAYADKTGATMHVPSESLFSAEHNWARATPDAIVLAGTEPLAPWDYLMQAKNVGYWPGKDWDEGPPVYVQLQELWEMYVTTLARADVAALIAGSDFRIYTVHRAEGMITDLVDIAAAFWRRVERREPPNIDGSEACRDHFTRRLAKVRPVELRADGDLEDVMCRWHDARADLKRAESLVERMRNTVLSSLDGARADRIVSSVGTAKLARTDEKTHKDTNWKYVAEMLAAATGARETFAELAKAATTTTTKPATVCLKEPREWSKESK
jgi:putative phage-type endonuclease